MAWSRSSRSAMCLAIGAGLSSVLGHVSSVDAQSNPNEPFIYQGGDDSSGAPAFNTSSTWSTGAAPAPGNNYVDDGWRIRTPPTTTTGANAISFNGDSLTVISPNPSPYLAYPQYGVGSINLGTSGSYGYLTLKGNGASNTTAINNLVLANGGVLFNYANDNQTVTGNIYLVPANTTLVTDSSGDTITTSVSGGIFDTHGDNLSGTAGTNNNYTVVASNISGGGMVRLENTGGGTSGATYIEQVLALSGSNTFTGGVILDGTSIAGTSGNGPDFAIDSANALGTGTFTILPNTSLTTAAPGLQIDNLTGASETLTTNNPQTWYGSFTFIGTNSLNMGSGAISMQAFSQVTVTANTLTLAGPINDGGYGFTKAGAGTLALNAAVTATGPVNVSAGILQLGGTKTNLSGGITVAATSSVALTMTHGILTTSSLTLAGSTTAWTSKLDIGNSSVDVQIGNLATLTNQAAEGYAAGTWQGSEGIVSSTAAADTSHLTAVGVILNSVNGSPIYGSGAPLGLFSGISPGLNDVLVKYTYYGDANLDGRVDGSDYSLIDAGFNSESNGSPLTGWYNGDFNYDGVIDGSDYTLIDNAFNTQGASLAAQIATVLPGGGTSAVPEPASIVLLVTSSLGWFRRRRLRHRPAEAI